MLTTVYQSYLVKLAGKFWDDPDDGEAECGEDGQPGGEQQHGAEQEDDTHEVPHEQTQLLTQRLTHGVSVGGDARYNVPWTENRDSVH